MRTIHKQQLKLVDRQELTMPAGAVIVNVAMQHGAITVWYVCDPKAGPDVRTFLVVGTGWDFDLEDADPKHVATVLTDNEFVWHVFEVVS